jgi:hypothetical protein
MNMTDVITKTDHKSLTMRLLRRGTRAVAMVYFVLFLFTLVVMLMMMNPHWGRTDYFVIWSSVFYLAGLITGLFSELYGGIICLLLSITNAKYSGTFVGIFISHELWPHLPLIVTGLFLMIPGILFLLSWYLHRKIKVETTI